MKHYKKLLFVLLAGSLTFAYSCKKSESNPSNPDLSLDLSTSSAKPGDVITITVRSTSSIKSYHLTVNNQGSAGAPRYLVPMSGTDSTIKNTSFTDTRSYTVPAGTTTNLVFTATVTDNNSLTSNASKTLTVSQPASWSKECSGVVLGDQNNATLGSSYSTSDCSVLTVSNAKSNSAKVDMIYYYGSTNNATLGAPDNSDVMSFSVFGLPWATNNSTRFKVLTSSDWTNASAGTIQSTYTSSSSAEMSEATKLAVGSVLGYKTAGGKYGILKVNGITVDSGSGNGTITFDSKTN